MTQWLGGFVIAMKFSEALIKYLAFGKFKNKESSMQTYNTHVRLLGVHLRNPEIEDIKSHHIIEYMTLMKEMGWDENTFNTKANAWKQFFRFWKNEGAKVLDPENIPVPTREWKMPRALTEEEYKKLLAVLEKHPKNIITLRNKTALRFLWDTGARLNEMLSLKVSDIDLKKMEAVIRTEKKRSNTPRALRTIFWKKQTHEYLKDYIRARAEFLKQKQFKDSDGWLWVAAHGKWKCGNPWRDHAVEITLKRVSYDANLGWTAKPHSFRHHFGRALAMGPKGDGVGGASPYILKDMLGHAQVSSSEIYTVMNQESMREVHKKFFKRR